jgi:hypothetical protein
MADGLVRIRVDRGALAAEVANHGVISADGGAVLLKAESLDALAPSVVNMTGIIEAQTVEQADGVVRLGSVELRADRVDVSSEARIEGSSIVAWGTDVAHVHGTLRARGARDSGGFIETSGHVLDTSGIRIDAGNGGEWLLDPWDLTISNNADVAVSGTDAIGTRSNLNAGVIQRALDSGTDVTVTTGGQGTETGNITVFGTADQGGAVNIAMTGSGNAVLTLRAAGSIDIHSGAGFTSTGGSLGLTLNSGNDNGVATGSGAISVMGATINTNGGSVVMGGGTAPLTGAAIGTQALVNGAPLLDGVHIGGNTTIATGAGSVTINGKGASDANNATGVRIDGNSRITVDGGGVTIAGTGGTGGSTNTGNEGVRIEGATVESRSGSGTIKISGTGGAGSDVHTGVRIASAAVKTVDASISINGAGGGTGKLNAGVLIDGGSAIETSGTGAIDIVGTSGAGTDRNFGISLENSTVRSTATGSGGISLDGTALGRGAPNDGIRLEGGTIDSLNTVGGSSIDLSGIGAGPGGNGVLALTGSPNPSRIHALSGLVSISGEAADSAGVGVWAQAGSTIDGGSVFIDAVGRIDIAENITTVDGLTDTSVSIFGDGIKIAGVTTGSATGFGASSVINISSNGDITSGALKSGDATANGSANALSWIGISATGAVATVSGTCIAILFLGRVYGLL